MKMFPKGTWAAIVLMALVGFVLPKASFGEEDVVETPPHGAEVVFGDEDFLGFVPGVDADGNLTVEGAELTEHVLQVTNKNFVRFTANAQVTNGTGKGFQAEGFEVAVRLPDGTAGLTTDTFLRVSANGNAVMHATYHLPQE